MQIFRFDELEIESPLTCLLRTFTLCKQYLKKMWMAVLTRGFSLGQDNLGKRRAV